MIEQTVEWPVIWPAMILMWHHCNDVHYSDVIMGMMASQITSLMIVCLTIYSSADQRKHQSSTSLAFVWGIHRWPVNSPHKGPVMRKMFPFDEVLCFESQLMPYTRADRITAQVGWRYKPKKWIQLEPPNELCSHENVIYWGPDKTVAILQTTFSNSFLFENYCILIQVAWGLFSMV